MVELALISDHELSDCGRLCLTHATEIIGGKTYITQNYTVDAKDC